MAQSERRSLLSSLDANTPFANGTIPMTYSSTINKGPGSSRQSMIPRQSMLLPNRYASVSGQENAIKAPLRKSIAPRSSMAVGLGHPGVGSSTGVDLDMAGPSSSSTPHRVASGATRRVENNPRTSVAMTPNNRQSMSARPSYAPNRGANYKPMQFVDPRLIREDRQLLMRMETDIQTFLQDTGFVFPPKYSGDFHMPSQALVMSAFRHIYHHCLDLKHVFITDPKKEPEEVMQLLANVLYPPSSEVSKTKLTAPGSIHNWPPICGMLHWIVCMKCSLNVPMTKYHGGPLERPLSSEDDDFYHYFPYLWYCYEQFWEGKDDYPEQLAQLDTIFEEKTRRCKEEIESLLEAETQKTMSLKTLKQTDRPLDFEESENVVLESDVKKFVEYKDVALVPRIKQFKSSISTHTQEIDMTEEIIRKAKREKDQYSKVVDAQNVTADDFEQMSRDRERLAEQSKQVMDRRQMHSTFNNHSEVYLSNKQSRVEEELKNVSDGCRDLDVFPFVLPDGSNLYDFDIVAGNSETMLPKGLDVKGNLTRILVKSRDTLGAQNRATTNEKIRDQENYDLLLEELEEYRDELSQIDTKLRGAKEQQELASTTFKEESRLQDEADANAEVAIAQLKQSARNLVDHAEARVQAAKMQINLVRDEDRNLRDELHQRFVAGLETILSLKSLVTEGFKSIEEAALSHSRPA